MSESDKKPKKLKIINEDEPDEQKKTIEVLFNPNEYTIEERNLWDDKKRRRGRTTKLQFMGGERKTLTMELFFDTYENNENKDVRVHTGKVTNLMKIMTTPNKDRPPICKIMWGDDPEGESQTNDFPFRGILEQVRQQFTMFDSNGTPVRAKLNVTFKEYQLPESEVKHRRVRGSYVAAAYTIKAGNTLGSIATRFLDAPKNWRLIAKHNNLDDPRRIETGVILQIPQIKD